MEKIDESVVGYLLEEQGDTSLHAQNPFPRSSPLETYVGMAGAGIGEARSPVQSSSVVATRAGQRGDVAPFEDAEPAGPVEALDVAMPIETKDSVLPLPENVARNPEELTTAPTVEVYDYRPTFPEPPSTEDLRLHMPDPAELFEAAEVIEAKLTSNLDKLAIRGTDT